MPSTYSSNLKIELVAVGEQDTTWGSTTNTNLGTALEQAITGTGTVTFASADVTLSFASSNASQPFRNIRLVLDGTTGGARNLIVPNIEKLYFIDNTTSDTITVKTSAGTGIAVPSGAKSIVYADAVNVVEAVTHLNSPSFSGTPTAPTAAPGTNTTQIATTAFIKDAIDTAVAATKDALYPIGSIYTNAVNATNPATLLGFGTWTAFGAGRVPVGFDSGDPLFDSAEETGGSKDAIVVSHTHTATVTDPGHTHGLTSVAGLGAGGGGTSYYGAFTGIPDGPGSVNTATTGITVANSTTGSSGTNANLQPYITVFMWKRTA